METAQDQCPGQFWSHLTGFQGSPPQASFVTSTSDTTRNVLCPSRFSSCLMFQNLVTQLMGNRLSLCSCCSLCPNLASFQGSPQPRVPGYVPTWLSCLRQLAGKGFLVQGSPQSHTHFPRLGLLAPQNCLPSISASPLTWLPSQLQSSAGPESLRPPHPPRPLLTCHH